MYKYEAILGASLIITILFLIGMLIYGTQQEAKEWEAFYTEHQCKVVGKKRGMTINTVDAKGNIGVITQSDSTAYACNNGITYWR